MSCWSFGRCDSRTFSTILSRTETNRCIFEPHALAFWPCSNEIRSDFQEYAFSRLTESYLGVLLVLFWHARGQPQNAPTGFFESFPNGGCCFSIVFLICPAVIVGVVVETSLLRGSRNTCVRKRKRTTSSNPEQSTFQWLSAVRARYSLISHHGVPLGFGRTKPSKLFHP